MAVLGNTLTLIAGEKAGIIKTRHPGRICTPTRRGAGCTGKISAERNAEFTLVGRDVTFEGMEHSLDGQTLVIIDQHSSTTNPLQGREPKSVILRIPLLGMHQVVNAVTAYTALQKSGLSLSEGSH